MDAFLSGVAVGQATSAAPCDAVDVFGRACVPRLTVHSSCQTASRSRTVGPRDLEPSRRAGNERGNQRRVRRVRLFPGGRGLAEQRVAPAERRWPRQRRWQVNAAFGQGSASPEAFLLCVFRSSADCGTTELAKGLENDIMSGNTLWISSENFCRCLKRATSSFRMSIS